MFLANSKQSRALDLFSGEQGVSVQTLMQKAGEGIASFLEKNARPEEGPVIFFIGRGNNGGDASVAAGLLSKRGFQTVCIRGEEELRRHKGELEGAAWIVDGLLGTGLRGEVQGWMRGAIDAINRSGAKVLSVDIPSGLSADNGIPLGTAVKATRTLSLGFVKLGVVLSPGVDYAGKVDCIDIGIPEEAVRRARLHCHLLEPSDFAELLKLRPKEAHKKDFGHVLVVAGSRGMPGAGFLASQAALRGGAGLATYVMPSKAFEKFQPDFAEVMVQEVPDEEKGFFTPKSVEAVLKLCEKKEAVVLGPGLGRTPETAAFVRTLVNQIPLPLVVDADALFSLSSFPRLLRQRPAATVLTPHPGEMALLLGWQTEEVQRARVAVASDAAVLWRCTVVLKGFRSLIALKNGDLYVNPTGNPGMATAGTGDVLAGLLGGLLAQSGLAQGGLAQGGSAETAALAGVYLHGLAGDLAAGELTEKGLIASDILRYLPKAFYDVEYQNKIGRGDAGLGPPMGGKP